MNTINKNLKKRKIGDKICGGIDSPSSCVQNVKIDDVLINFTVPSRDSTTTHIVKITAENNELLFECDCRGGFRDIKSQSCIHIDSVLVNFCRKYIENAFSFTESKEKYIKTKQSVDSLMDEMNKLHF